MVFLFCVDLRSVEKQITRQFLAPSAHSVSHRSPRFAQMRCAPHAKESVPIRRADGASKPRR